MKKTTLFLSHSAFSTTTCLTWICVKNDLFIANIWAWVPWAVEKKNLSTFSFDLQSVCVYFLWSNFKGGVSCYTLNEAGSDCFSVKMQFTDDNGAFCRCLYFNGNVLCIVTACLNFCKCCVSIYDLCVYLPTFRFEILYCIIICLKHGNTDRRKKF